MFTNKRVALVGPAKYLDTEDTDDYTDVDLYGDVVRINHGVMLCDEIRGLRTTCLMANAFCCKVHKTNVLNNLPDKVICTTPYTTNNWKKHVNRFKDEVESRGKRFYSIDPFLTRTTNLFRKFSDGIPTSGIFALHYLMQINPHEIYLTGLDFFHGGDINYSDKYHSSDDKKEISEFGHDVDSEFKMFIHLLSIAKCKITLDPYLQKLVANTVK